MIAPRDQIDTAEQMKTLKVASDVANETILGLFGGSPKLATSAMTLWVDSLTNEFPIKCTAPVLCLERN
ncbi:hypothetical protein COLO4_28697 [Corchorus olitorius]|uniref:Uncharacterized protein n=1 Tax=Corchorus olitorius TaxID=93759 RepID=A0A1R3HIX9_9ROSI|nr:hypothetical protein COLO4_28697 [Corchorus olitorius]